MKKWKKIFSILLAISLLVCAQITNVYASENSQGEVLHGLFDIVAGQIQGRAGGISAASLTASFVSNGANVNCKTQTSSTASTIGVKNVRLQKYNGSSWTTIASNNAGGSSTNSTLYVGAFGLGYNLVHGEQYRVYCMHYAYINGVYYTHENYTQAKTY